MVGTSVGFQQHGVNMNKELRTAVEEVIVTAMDSVMDIAERRRVAPLYTALVPEEIFKSSHFERRFVTLFGSVWEKLAAVMGEKTFGFGANQHMIVGRVRQGCLDRIQKTLDTLEHKGRDGRRTQPNWRKELQHVQGGTGPWQDVSVNCDVYVSESSELPGLAFELKAPKPNSDQTKASKEKLLRLHCMNPRPVKQAYFALPYNPYGSRERYGWSFPGRWFNMREDPCVLIGDELWDKLGGKKSYEAIVEIANRVGRRYKRRIYEDYLGIPAPQELS